MFAPANLWRAFFRRDFLSETWWWALLIVAVCSGVAAPGRRDILNLLPPDEPTVQGLKLYQKYFTNARELVVTLPRAGRRTRREARKLARDTVAASRPPG